MNVNEKNLGVQSQRFDKLVPAYASGLSSIVLSQGVVIGHVLFCDFDSDVGIDVILDEISKLNGVCVLFSSSNQHFHLMNLAIRDRNEVALLKLSMQGDDAKHTKIGYRRRRWILRCDDKKGFDGETLKRKPVFSRIFFNDADMDFQMQSRIHRRLLKEIYDVEMPQEMIVRYVWGGDETEIETYMTYEGGEKGWTQ